MAAEVVDFEEFYQVEADYQWASLELADITSRYLSGTFDSPQEEARVREVYLEAVKKQNAAEKHLIYLVEKNVEIILQQDEEIDS